MAQDLLSLHQERKAVEQLTVSSSPLIVIIPLFFESSFPSLFSIRLLFDHLIYRHTTNYHHCNTHLNHTTGETLKLQDVVSNLTRPMPSELMTSLVAFLIPSSKGSSLPDDDDDDDEEIQMTSKERSAESDQTTFFPSFRVSMHNTHFAGKGWRRAADGENIRR